METKVVSFEQMPELIQNLVERIEALEKTVREKQQPQPLEGELMSVEDVCKLLGKSKSAVYRTVRCHDIPFIRQGNDCGTRYRTGIYYTTEEDIATIRKVYNDMERIVGEPLMVEVEPLRNFYPAEEYHQDYLDKNPRGYCHIPFELMIMAREANKE